MTRKVFAARSDAGALQLFDDHAAELCDDLRLLAQRPIADHGVFRICVNVEHRRIVERDPDRSQLCGEGAGKTPRQLLVIASAEYRHGRPLCEGRPKAGYAAAFLVDPDPRRHLDAEVSHVEGQTGHLFGRFDVSQPAEEGDPAQIELASEGSHFDRYVRPREAADEQLSYAAPKRLRRHDLSL